MLNRRRRDVIAAFTCLTFFSGVSVAAERIVLGSTAFPPLVDVGSTSGYMDLVVREAFARLGIEAMIESLPGDRALRMANEGLTDGEAIRAAGLEKEYPNLVQVPEPVLEAEYMAWSMRRETLIAGWEGLRSLVVGYPIGWKMYDRQVTQAREIVRVRNMEQLFPMLAASRLDVALLDRYQGMYLASRAGIDAYPVEPPLLRSKMYIYLHVRHRALVNQLAAAIKAMRADGTLKRIFDQTLKPYGSGMIPEAS
jgi:polar amino acid transport system substrate-binding protein